MSNGEKMGGPKKPMSPEAIKAKLRAEAQARAREAGKKPEEPRQQGAPKQRRERPTRDDLRTAVKSAERPRQNAGLGEYLRDIGANVAIPPTLKPGERILNRRRMDMIFGLGRMSGIASMRPEFEKAVRAATDAEAKLLSTAEQLRAVETMRQELILTHGTQVRQLESRLGDMEGKENEARARAEGSLEQMSRLKESHAEQLSQLQQTLEKRTTEFKTQAAQLNSRLQAEMVQAARLRKELDDVSVSDKNSTVELAEARKYIAQLKQALSDHEQLVRNVQSTLTTEQARNTGHQSEIADLAQTVQRLKTEIERLSVSEQMARERQNDLLDLQSHQGRLKGTVSNLEQEKSELAGEITRLKEALNRAQRDLIEEGPAFSYTKVDGYTQALRMVSELQSEAVALMRNPEQLGIRLEDISNLVEYAHTKSAEIAAALENHATAPEPLPLLHQLEQRLEKLRSLIKAGADAPTHTEREMESRAEVRTPQPIEAGAEPPSDESPSPVSGEREGDA